eukprot:TRINITY_DN30620_c0_g1_i1.p1 TRINITY_DN30620_c0_g1~~TRINITY_DN30620_c0_g1_i1.p1  ORF type:complete len:222 (+),score=26.11 TRINITY_DN30620_c0_g1_i1:51-716(+)
MPSNRQNSLRRNPNEVSGDGQALALSVAVEYLHSQIQKLRRDVDKRIKAVRRELSELRCVNSTSLPSATSFPGSRVEEQSSAAAKHDDLWSASARQWNSLTHSAGSPIAKLRSEMLVHFGQDFRGEDDTTVDALTSRGSVRGTSVSSNSTPKQSPKFDTCTISRGDDSLEPRQPIADEIPLLYSRSSKGSQAFSNFSGIELRASIKSYDEGDSSNSSSLSI